MFSIGFLLSAFAGEFVPCNFDHPVTMQELKTALSEGCYLPVGSVLSFHIEDYDDQRHVIGFTNGGSQLSTESLASIDVMSRIMKNKPDMSVVVVGHADPGEMGDLQKISEDRAKTAIDIMILNGISPNRLSYVGRGATQPIDTTGTRAGAAKNRRVEFVLAQTAQ